MCRVQAIKVPLTNRLKRKKKTLLLISSITTTEQRIFEEKNADVQCCKMGHR